jgi:type IV pilus assembly protein PilW
MVAATISLLMMLAVLQLMLDTARTNEDMARTNAQIENGRFAIQMISHDLMHAGFWDGYIPQYDDLVSAAVPAGYPTQFIAPAPCASFAGLTVLDKENLLRMPLQSFSAMPAGCTGLTGYKTGTDVLVVRYASNCAVGTTGCAASEANRVYFQTSSCASDSPYGFVLDTTDFTLTKVDCNPLNLADRRLYISHIYYVRNDDTLMRAQFVGGASEWQVQPLVDGVEYMVVELGVDNLSDAGQAVNYTQAVSWADPLNKRSPQNRGDGEPDGAFVRCASAGCTVDQLLNVVAAKIHLLVRAPEEMPGYTDGKTYALGNVSLSPGGGFKRHLYSTSVRLHNVAGRRETP